MIQGLRQPKVDDLGCGFALDGCDQNVGGFEIAMNDPFLVCMVDCLADSTEELQSILERKLVLIAVFGNREPLNPLHDEIRKAIRSFATVEDSGDTGVIHQS